VRPPDTKFDIGGWANIVILNAVLWPYPVNCVNATSVIIMRNRQQEEMRGIPHFLENGSGKGTFGVSRQIIKILNMSHSRSATQADTNTELLHNFA